MSTDPCTKSIDLGEDNGFVTFTFAGQSFNIDVIGVWETFRQHSLQHRESPTYLESLPALAMQCGMPDCSQRAALQFFSRLATLVEEIQARDAIFAQRAGPPELPPELKKEAEELKARKALEKPPASGVGAAVDAFKDIADTLKVAHQTLQQAMPTE